MAKNRIRSRIRRQRSISRKMRGGGYTSATTYGESVNGSTGSQIARAFGPTGTGSIIGEQEQGAMNTFRIPTQAQLALAQATQAGGRRKSRRGRKSKRGGFLAEIVNQAVVPGAILAMQQTYRRKSRGTKYTRRN
jgi:hypothetical protein